MNVTSRVCCAVIAIALGFAFSAAGSSFAQPNADPGLAATPAAREISPGPDDKAAAWVSKSHDLESVLGREIHTSIEEGVGRIVDLLADRRGRVEAAVIEFGGFLGIGTRKIAVEWSALSFAGEGKQTKIILDMTRDQLRKAPEYKANEPAIVRKADR